MSQTSACTDKTTAAPQGFRDALAELVQIGLSVARMVGRIAEAETAQADAASRTGVDAGVSALAGSLAEAIDADRAAAAAAEARHTVVARGEAIAAAFARVSRSVRLTVHLAERLDRGWARGGVADDRQSMARRHIAREVGDAIARQAEGERAERLNEALVDRLEALDTEALDARIGDRPVEQIIAEICRDLGLDPARMILRPPVREAAGVVEPAGVAPLTGDGSDWGRGEDLGRGTDWPARPPRRQPDG